MKHKFLTMSLMLVASITTSMATEVEGLTVSYLTEGSTDYVQALSVVGRITFEAGDSESSKHAFIKFNDTEIADEDLGEISDINRITFGKIDESDITTKEVETSVVEIEGVDENQTIHIFNLSGILVDVQQGAKADLDSFERGTYIIQCGTKIIKVIKN